MSDEFKVANDDYASYGLLALKPIYGLNDAPLAWQLNLHGFLIELGATQSHLDENAWVWKKKQDTRGAQLSLANCEYALTTHVDDLGLSGPAKWRDEMHDRFLKKYKKVTRQTLPFTHCGCEYEQTGDGYLIRQKDFARKLEKAEVPKRDDSSRLTPEEVTTYRSILGALLWITATRLDVIADVSILQSRVTVAEIKDLKLANDTVDKVKEFSDLGLHYRFFRTQHTRLVCVHDASAATKTRHYAQEGILIYLAEDFWYDDMFEHEHTCETIEDEAKHNGMMHLLFAHGAKAKRVSYSTSHGETLAMASALEAGTLCMVRLSEMMHPKIAPTLQDLIELQEHGNDEMPMDFYGDAKDVYELVTGSKTLPQDKTQRLYVLAFREARLDGRCRMVALIPTECMISDPLTKSMLQATMLQYLTTGVVEFYGVDKHPIVARTMPRIHDLDEHMLERGDDDIIREFRGQNAGQHLVYFLTARGDLCGESVPSSAREYACPAALPAQELRRWRSFSSFAMDVLIGTIGMTAILAVFVERLIAYYWFGGRHAVQGHPQVAHTLPPTRRLPASPRPSTSVKREHPDELLPGHDWSADAMQRTKLNARCQNLLMEVTGLRRDLRTARILENQMTDQIGDLKKKIGRLEDELQAAERTMDQSNGRWREREDELRSEISRLNADLAAARAAVVDDQQLANDAAIAAQGIVQRARQAAALVPPAEAVVITNGGSRWHHESCNHARGRRTYQPCRVCNARQAE